LGFSRNVCAMAHVVPEASPNCTLPRTVKLALDADVEKARNRCVEEDKDGPTVQALLGSAQIMTSGLGTVIVEAAEPAPIAPSLKARGPSPKTGAVAAAPSSPRAALAEPIPVPAVVPKAPVQASKSAAIPSAAATTVVPPEAALQDTKRQRTPTHVGWIVQIGAFDIERDAQRQLSTAHAKAGPVLDNADPYTEVVMKGDKTLYRARFAGFQQKDEAEAACKQLKLSNIDCITIKN
jgi:D-alanyl-D-alanine carboxypeptidase